MADRGQLLFADARSNRILQLSAGRLHVVAGRGPTPCGDGRLATGGTLNGGAYFGHLGDVAVDSKGNRYIADKSFNQVRRVRPDGRVDLVIGEPTPCAYVGLIPQADPYHFSDPCPETGVQSGDGGVLERASLADPNAVLVDSNDNVLISDNDRVRYVNLSSHSASAFGTVVAPHSIQTVRGLVFPGRTVHVDVPFWKISGDVPAPIGDLALDGRGNLYIADELLRTVYAMSPCGVLTVVAGTAGAQTVGDGGPAVAAALSPAGLAIDPARDILFIDDAAYTSTRTAGSRIRAVNLGKAPVTAYGVTLAPGAIDSVVGVAGAQCSRFCSYGDGGGGRLAGTSGPTGLAFSSTGRLYFMDSMWQRLRVLLPNGTVAGLGAPWRENRNANFQETIETPLGYAGDGGPALTAWFGVRDMDQGWLWSTSPGLALTPAGDLAVTDAAGRVREIRDVQRAPLRLGPNPTLAVAAGVGYSKPVVMGDVLADASLRAAGDAAHGNGANLPPALQQPDLVTGDRYTAVLGGRGPGFGCQTWLIDLNADGRGHDTGWSRGEVGTGTAAGSIGGNCVGTHANVMTPPGHLDRRNELPDPDGLLVPAPVGGVAPTEALAVAATVRAESLDGPGNDLSVLAAVSSDGGGSWKTNPSPLLADRAGQSGLGAVSIGRVGAATMIAASTRTGDIAVLKSLDGVLYKDDSRIPVQTSALGTLSQTRDGRALLTMIRSKARADSQPDYFITVAVQTAPANWIRNEVAKLPPAFGGGPAASPPSLAVDAAGRAYVAWSNKSAVFLSSSSDLMHWTAARRITGTEGAVLPTIVAGQRGAVAIAYYATLTPRRTADDPYAAWYVAVSQASNADTPKPQFATRLASPSAVHTGVLCLAVACSSPGSTLPQIGASPTEAGPPKIRLGAAGDVEVVFSVDADAFGGNPQGLGFIRSCTWPSLLGSHLRPPCDGKHAPSAKAAIPDVSSNRAVVMAAVPLLSCSAITTPRPAPQKETPQTRQSHRQPHLQPHPAQGPLVVPPFVPAPPAQAALPPGQAPAQAAQSSQSAQNAQAPGAASQPGAQVGLSPAEQEQRRSAHSFAATRSASDPISTAGLYWLATLTAVTTVVATRRRPMFAEARVTHG
jgi:hypothetical protein